MGVLRGHLNFREGAGGQGVNEKAKQASSSSLDAKKKVQGGPPPFINLEVFGKDRISAGLSSGAVERRGSKTSRGRREGPQREEAVFKNYKKSKELLGVKYGD